MSRPLAQAKSALVMPSAWPAPLNQLDPVTVWIGDPAGLRSVRAAGTPWWLGRDPFGGKIGESRVERLNLDDKVIDAAAGAGLAFRGVVV